MKPHSLVSTTSEIFKLWSSSFSSKCSKFHVDLKNAIKITENVFCFWHNCMLTSWWKISLLRQEYMLSTVNLLKHSPKISNLTKRDLSELDLSDINGKLAKKHWCPTFQQCFGPVPLLRRKYMLSTVNLLKHSPNVSDLTKRDLSVVDLSDINDKLA